MDVMVEDRADQRSEACRDIFVTHKDYPKLLAGAHRRRISTIAAPAVIRHLAFWNPAKIGPDEGGEGSRRGHVTAGRAASDIIRKRVEAADRCIAAVYKGLVERSRASGAGDIADLTTNSEVDVGHGPLVVLFGSVIRKKTGTAVKTPDQIRPDTYRSIKIRFLWHSISTTLDFELHTEFLTLTTILEASTEMTPGKIAEVRGIGGSAFALLYDGLCGLARARQADTKVCRDLHEQLYKAIWTQVESDLLKPLEKLAPSLGKKFADFRGVVLGPPGSSSEVDFSPPFSRRGTGPGTGLEREPNCEIDDFDGLWSFMTCALPHETEFTLTVFSRIAHSTPPRSAPNRKSSSASSRRRSFISSTRTR